MTPITYVRSKSSEFSSVRAVASTLDPLLSVLAVIRRVNNGEVGLKTDDRAERETLSSIRSAAYSIRSILNERAPELDLELTTRYSSIILSAVEGAVKVDACNQVLECTPWKGCACLFQVHPSSPTPFRKLVQKYSYSHNVFVQKAHKKTYPSSHTLCHSADFSFPNSPARDHLRQTLTDTFDELQISFPDNDEALIQPIRKRRRDPPWGMTTSVGQAFHAISKCRHGSVDCGIIEHLEANLALATYLDVGEEDEHFIDLLFAFDAERPRCDEVRVHAHGPGPAPISTGRPRVMFVDERRKRQKPMKRLKKVPHFCELLGAPKVHNNAVFRVNVTVEADNTMWLHRHTPRVLKEADLSHPISLAAILASDTRELSDMARLVLAVILSYSLFYLFEGPWLGSRQDADWSRDNIIFFKQGGKVPLRPFLRSDLSGNNSLASNEDSRGADDEESLHQYPALLCFGITLLEIHLGGTIESFLGLTEPLTSLDDKYARTCEVFEKRKPFIRGEYREAIKACLDTQFGADDEEADWSESEDENEPDDWRAADEHNVEHLRGMIFNEIVRPLHDDLEKSFGTLMEGQDNLDKQAANMDFRSGLSIAEMEVVSQTKNHDRHQNSTNEEAFAQPEVSRFSLRRSGHGNLHTLTADPSPQQSTSPQEHSPTDDWFARFQGLEALFPLRQLEPGDTRRVRIAIIDTGIDMGHVDIQAAAVNGQIAKVCDWVDGREGVEDENIGDASGHGTHIASVILNMAPHVDLYIARVTKRRELFDTEAENVAKVRTLFVFTFHFPHEWCGTSPSPC